MSEAGLFAALDRYAHERRRLAGLLGADGGTYAYYVCPLSTIPRILDEGIRCRRHSERNDSVDLSGPEVQRLRLNVNLCRSRGDGTRAREQRPIHYCVNLFWNPLNSTFWSFQRNGLFAARRSGNPDDGELCVLEVDVRRLLADTGALWCCTSGNAAAGSTRYSSEAAELQNNAAFAWSGIFDTRYWELGHRDPGAGAPPGAAELIVLVPGGVDARSAPVPPHVVRRVIVDAESQMDSSRYRIEVSRCAGLRVPPCDLLKAEEALVGNLLRMTLDSQGPAFTEAFFLALRRMVDFQRALWPVGDSQFENDAAYGPHGIGHTTRVMLWSSVVAHLTHADQGVGEAAMAAAFVHDLCRTTSGEDSNHGRRAAEKHRDLLWVLVHFDDDKVRQVARAVELHCVDDQGPLSPATRILKDADALDRGRFGQPNQPRGCNTDFLRTHELKKIGEEAAWLAWNLARMTRYLSWGPKPACQLVCRLRDGLDLCLEHGCWGADISRRLLAMALREHCDDILKDVGASAGCDDALPGDDDIPF